MEEKELIYNQTLSDYKNKYEELENKYNSELAINNQLIFNNNKLESTIEEQQSTISNLELKQSKLYESYTSLESKYENLINIYSNKPVLIHNSTNTDESDIQPVLIQSDNLEKSDNPDQMNNSDVPELERMGSFNYSKKQISSDKGSDTTDDFMTDSENGENKDDIDTYEIDKFDYNKNCVILENLKKVIKETKRYISIIQIKNKHNSELLISKQNKIHVLENMFKELYQLFQVKEKKYIKKNKLLEDKNKIYESLLALGNYNKPNNKIIKSLSNNVLNTQKPLNLMSNIDT
jgi:hypothetical protein